ASSGGLNGVGAVHVIVPSGNTVYVGGGFTQIGGQPRRHVAALDAASGLATNWDPNANNEVRAMALSGSTVYMGGWFSTMGGEQRAGLAAVDGTTGTVLDWKADAGDVNALALSGNTLYVAGLFDTIASQPRSSLAALDPVTGALKDWNPKPTGTVGPFPGPRPRTYALAVRGHTVYVGGGFSSI